MNRTLIAILMGVSATVIISAPVAFAGSNDLNVSVNVVERKSTDTVNDFDLSQISGGSGVVGGASTHFESSWLFWEKVIAGSSVLLIIWIILSYALRSRKRHRSSNPVNNSMVMAEEVVPSS